MMPTSSKSALIPTVFCAFEALIEFSLQSGAHFEVKMELWPQSGLHFADLIHVLFGKFLTKTALTKLYQIVPSSIKKYPIGG